MRRFTCLAAGTLLTAGFAAAAQQATEFDEASIHVERNATDGDTEIVIHATPGDDGLRHLRIRTPRGKQVVLLGSKDEILGMREFIFESPEPEGDAILDVYPKGRYEFEGVSVTGERFRSTAKLSHDLPDPVEIVHPGEDEVIAPGALTIEWTPVAGVAQYIVEFENESADPEQTLQVNLRADATSFEVPASLVVPGAVYQVGVATVAENGNVVFVEVAFSTAD